MLKILLSIIFTFFFFQKTIANELPVVSVTKVSKVSVTKAIKVNGFLKGFNSIRLITGVNGKVLKILVKSGEIVKKGQLLLVLDNQKEKAQVLQASTNLENKTLIYNNNTLLYKKKAISKELLTQSKMDMLIAKAQLDAAQVVLDDTYLKAPFSGQLGLIQASIGDWLSASTTITTLDDLDHLYIDFPISENDLPYIKIGNPVTIQSTIWNNKNFDGKILAIDSRVDPDTLTINIRVNVPNVHHWLKPGMLLTGHIVLDTVKQLIVPVPSIVYDGADTFVFIYNSKTKQAIKHPVTIGSVNKNHIQIIAGLKENQCIVDAGTQKLLDTQIVSIKDDHNEQQSCI